jgi:hypothetical protein
MNRGFDDDEEENEAVDVAVKVKIKVNKRGQVVIDIPGEIVDDMRKLVNACGGEMYMGFFEYGLIFSVEEGVLVSSNDNNRDDYNATYR